MSEISEKSKSDIKVAKTVRGSSTAAAHPGLTPLSIKGTGISPASRITKAHADSDTARTASLAPDREHQDRLDTHNKITKAADRAWKPSNKMAIGRGSGLIAHSGLTMSDNEKPDLIGSSHVCRDCHGAVADHSYPAGSDGKPDRTKPLLHSRIPRGAKHIGGHPDKPFWEAPAPSSTASAMKRGNGSLGGPAKHGNNWDSVTRASVLGKKGMGSASDKKNRNIEKPIQPDNEVKPTRFITGDALTQLRKKAHYPEGLFTNLLDLIFEYKLTAPGANQIKSWSPNKPLIPLSVRRAAAVSPEAGSSSSEKEKTLNAVKTNQAAFGIVAGRVINNKPSGTEQFMSLFKNGESYMNPNAIANKIIREAFTSGDRNNTTPNDNDMYVQGGTQRQMLAGEMVGSVVWPFDQSINPMFDKLVNFEMGQAKDGLFGKAGSGSAMEAVANEIVDDLLDDSPSAILSDPSSVGYLINEMYEAGYVDFSAKLKDICEDAKEEDVIQVSEMIEKLEEDKADTFLIEQLTRFANQYLIAEVDSATTSDVNSPKEDAASETDDNKSET